MLWTHAHGRAGWEVRVQDSSGGPGRQGESRPSPHIPVGKPLWNVTNSPPPARLRNPLPFSPHPCLLPSLQDGVPKG